MSFRLPVLIYDEGIDPIHLVNSAETFIVQNSYALNKFRLILYMYRPSHETVELVKSQFLHYTPYLTAGSKPPCVPCIWSKHKTRYGVVIPSSYISIKPLWPYIEEFRYTIHSVPDLHYIRLTPDNTTSRIPKVYHKHTRHIYLTSGVPIPPTSPVLTKAKPPDHTPIVSGALKPLVFREQR